MAVERLLSPQIVSHESLDDHCFNPFPHSWATLSHADIDYTSWRIICKETVEVVILIAIIESTLGVCSIMGSYLWPNCENDVVSPFSSFPWTPFMPGSGSSMTSWILV